MKVLSLFDGISCGMVALERAGIPVERYVAYEIEENAIKVSETNYPQIEHKGDVFKAEYKEGEFDLLIGGSPCFVAGTMVRTIDGIKPIEEIKVGDKVLTHKGRYKTVTTTMSRTAPSTVIVKAENCGEIECTKEHPFYTRNMKRVFNNEQRKSERTLDNNFNWIDPEHFETIKNDSETILKQTYLTSTSDEIEKEVEYNGVDLKVNQYGCTKHVNTLNLNDKNLWYFIGRWLGDGWFNYKYKKTKKLSGVKICCGKHELKEFEDKLKLTGFKYYKSEERTTYKFTICNVELAIYLQRFGEGASNKHLAPEVYFLPKELALSFLDGYIDADGNITNDYIYSFSSISKELAYGIKYMVNKYLNVVCSIMFSDRKCDVIEGRKVNVKNSYIGTFHNPKQSQAHYFVENNYIMAAYKSVTYLNESKTVYNLSVEDDESYTANGIVVHNCTYWSIAKAGDSRETTSSGFGWELFMQYVRALREAKPKYFLYENNESMSDAIKEEITKQLGVEPIIINSADFSAQIRKRYYWTNIPVNLNYEPSELVFADIEYPHDYRIVDISKYKDTLRVNKEGTQWAWDTSGKGYYSQQSRARSKYIKTNTVPASGGDKNNIYLGDYKYRKMHPIEAERAQTLPDDYTSCIKSKTKRIGLCGNGWTVDVIAHILKGLKEKEMIV